MKGGQRGGTGERTPQVLHGMEIGVKDAGGGLPPGEVYARAGATRTRGLLAVRRTLL